ncbi:hypothetical protein BX666DRAFT_1863089 [Dichotomocladium elegans]|nr:hypothetical protein BX666DRAFT_1863089 [Dichotomocladium elegans]
MARGKVAIIGAGSVGSTVAYALLMREVAAEILLVDIASNILHGQVLDLTEAIMDSPTVVRAGTFKEAGQADVIVVTAHSPWTTGLSENEWIKRNQRLMRSIIFALLPIAPQAVLIVGAEPVDLLTLQIQEKANIPRHRIFGVGSNTRKTGRARAWAAEMIFVIGSETIPLVAWHSASIDGEPASGLADLWTNRVLLEHIVSTDRMSEIAKLKGGAWFGPAAVLARVTEAVLEDQEEVYVVSTYVDEFETCVAVPAVVTRDGVQRQVPLNLSPDEQLALKRAADHTHRLYQDTIRDLDDS